MSKTLFIKENSISEFSKGIINTDHEKTVRGNSWLLSDIIIQKFPICKIEFYRKELLEGYDTIIFEIQDRTEVSGIDFISKFTYKVEPYDDILVKIVLDSSSSVLA